MKDLAALLAPLLAAVRNGTATAGTADALEQALGLAETDPAIDALPEDWSRTVLFRAVSRDEASEHTPRWAKRRVDRRFLRRLMQARALIRALGLTELRYTDGPDAWGLDEAAARLQGGELVITGDAFWFVDRPKYDEHDIETVGEWMPPFVDGLLRAPDGVIVAAGVDDPDSLLEAYLDHAPADARTD